jgi:hypothetical protein
MLRFWKIQGIILPETLNKTSATRNQPPPSIELTNFEFVKLVKEEDFRIQCFYELKISPVSKFGKVIQMISSDRKLLIPQRTLLDKHLSTLRREFPATPFSATYETMCKYAGPLDPNYRTVVDTLKGLIEFSTTRQLWKIVGATDVLSSEQEQQVWAPLALRADPNLWNYDGKCALHLAV